MDRKSIERYNERQRHSRTGHIGVQKKRPIAVLIPFVSIWKRSVFRIPGRLQAVLFMSNNQVLFIWRICYLDENSPFFMIEIVTANGFVQIPPPLPIIFRGNLAPKPVRIFYRLPIQLFILHHFQAPQSEFDSTPFLRQSECENLSTTFEAENMSSTQKSLRSMCEKFALYRKDGEQAAHRIVAMHGVIECPTEPSTMRHGTLNEQTLFSIQDCKTGTGY